MLDALSFLIEKNNEKYGLLWGATTADWGDVQPEHEWGVNIDNTSHLCIEIYDNAMFIIAIKDYIQITHNADKAMWKKVCEQIASNVRKYL